MLVVMLVAGCLDPEGTLGQLFLDNDVKTGVDGASGLASLFGPVGAAAGSATATLYAVGRSYFTSKKANKDKDTFEAELARSKKALHGVVDGLQKAKKLLPEEHLDELHDGLKKHVPDWVHEVVNEVKGKPQQYIEKG